MIPRFAFSERTFMDTPAANELDSLVVRVKLATALLVFHLVMGPFLVQFAAAVQQQVKVVMPPKRSVISHR